MEGTVIGTGGGARLGGDNLTSSVDSGSGFGFGSGSSRGSVWVHVDVTSNGNLGEGGVSTFGIRTVGVAGGLNGCSIVCEEVEVITLGE